MALSSDILAQVHPVLFHIGPVLIPAYGVMAALGVLLALLLALRTARIADVNPNHLWNLCILALFTALAGSRLLLVAVNWTVVRSHPAWLLSLAMVHHPLLAAAGALLAFSAAALYARRQRMPLRQHRRRCGRAARSRPGLRADSARCLPAPATGFETAVPWAVTYTHPLAARWSGAPLGVPVHPVQAYAALAFLTISICASRLDALPPPAAEISPASGSLATGAAIYFTEFWRDPEGRGAMLRGAIDGPQLAAIALVLAGALLLRRRDSARIAKRDATTQAENPIDNSSKPARPA